jgi:hypothetical protein
MRSRFVEEAVARCFARFTSETSPRRASMSSSTAAALPMGAPWVDGLWAKA